MKKIILLIAFLFICLTFAKTWEAYLQRCDGLGGFWFPDHNWTDKGEPWIKPFLFGENLRDYGETGLSFNYIEPESACRSYYDCNDLYNPFDLKYTAPQNSKYSTNDSILFLVHRKQVDSVDNLNTKENITGGFPEESFSLVDVIDDALFIDSIPFTMFDAYQYSPFGYLFIYKKRSDKFEYNALCLIQNSMFYKIQCEFQDDGTMNFDKIPDLNTIPKDFCSAYENMKIQPGNSKIKEVLSNVSSYKVNGTHSKNGSSKVIIKNYQPTLQLKGELK